RFAVIDAIGNACTVACDLSAQVPGLVDALRCKGKPDYASGSGMWQTRGLAWSAAKALTYTVRWGDARVVDEVALALVVRAQAPSALAGAAVAEGLARSGRAADIAIYLNAAKTSAGAREGLLRGLLAVDEPVSGALAIAVRALRVSDDADVALVAALVRAVDDGLAEESVVRGNRLSSEDAGVRKRELADLNTRLDDPARCAHVQSMATALLPHLARTASDEIAHSMSLTVDVAGVIAKLGDGGAPLVDHVDAFGAAWARTYNDRAGVLLARCLRTARKQGADITRVVARLRDKAVAAGAADLLAPSDGAWSPDQVKALVAKLALPMRETHPSSFAAACEAVSQAAALLAHKT
ncbi:MAG TPA: hypothetical protein VGO62_14735, partial [Myxococcota bacterium]